jgi:CheY-like chemotaxis protein
MSEKKSKVMVVDDDESVRDSLRKLLDGEGYQVILAANGLEAVETFRREQNQIDLVLVDLNMPMKNGWVTLNDLLEASPFLPVFVLTGLSHQSELAMAAGVCALVEKPIDVSELLQLIKKQLVEPARSRIQHPGHRFFSFRHLRAARYALNSLSAGRDIAAYNHWGLNE